MPFKLRWCPVLKTHITYVTDLEDRAIRVICYEYEEATGACRVKRHTQSDGVPAQLCESESSARTPELLCSVV